MGNIFYGLLTKKFPFEDLSTRKTQKAVKAGKRPPVDDKFIESSDPFTKALVKAMKMCWTQSPESRATARAVEQFIDSELTRLGVMSETAETEEKQ